MSAAPLPLSEFSRSRAPERDGVSGRVVAGLLTAAFYGLFALLVWYSFLGTPPPGTVEIVATLLPDGPPRKIAPPQPPPIAHMIKPRAESIAPPVFTYASGPTTAPAPLPALAVKVSPMPGGSAGNGPMGQAGSANGTGGNGAGLANCLDPAWVRAVSERVRQFFYYPDAALALHTTGVAIMRFTVRHGGQLEKVEIGKSSGDSGLDRAANDIMHKAQPLPPIPERMHVDRVDGVLPINFGVRNFSGAPTISHCGS